MWLFFLIFPLFYHDEQNQTCVEFTGSIVSSLWIQVTAKFKFQSYKTKPQS